MHSTPLAMLLTSMHNNDEDIIAHRVCRCVVPISALSFSSSLASRASNLPLAERLHGRAISQACYASRTVVW